MKPIISDDEIDRLRDALLYHQRQVTELRELIARREKEARRARGGPGRPEIGQYSALGNAVKTAASRAFDAQVMPVIREMQRAGVKTQVEIAARLTARGIKPPKGEVWYPMQVRRMLLRADPAA